MGYVKYLHVSYKCSEFGIVKSMVNKLDLKSFEMIITTQEFVQSSEFTQPRKIWICIYGLTTFGVLLYRPKHINPLFL